MVSISFARKLYTALLLFSLAIGVQARLGSEKIEEHQRDPMTRILGILKSIVNQQDIASGIPETVILNEWPENETFHEQLLLMIRNSLTEDVIIGDSTGAKNSERFFTLYVPLNAEALELMTHGGSGDIDLYVKYGAPPTTASYDCRSLKGGPRQSCVIPNPEKGSYYVMLLGNGEYSDAKVIGAYKQAAQVPSARKLSPVGVADTNAGMSRNGNGF